MKYCSISKFFFVLFLVIKYFLVNVFTSMTANKNGSVYKLFLYTLKTKYKC